MLQLIPFFALSRGWLVGLGLSHLFFFVEEKEEEEEEEEAEEGSSSGWMGN